MVRVIRWLALAWLPCVAACTAVPSAKPPTHTPPVRQRARTAVPPSAPVAPPKPKFQPPQVQKLPGLEMVIDMNARTLIDRFGQPQLDVHEGDMRKLQFAGERCVLDVYLYPLKPGGEPLATYVDARRASDGLDVDRAACIAALMK